MARHGGIQADMVLDTELRVLHLDPQATKKSVSYTGLSLSIGDLNTQTHSDTLPQQGHIYSHKMTFLNHAASYGGHFLSSYHENYEISVSGGLIC